MGRRLRRDLHKRISSAGYQKITGDLEVTGKITGQTISGLFSAIQVAACSTQTPVKLTITRCEGAYKAIILQWQAQYNLATFDHYDVQVSADETNWFSLKFDGTDWKDTLNAWTEVRQPLMVHIPIPFDGTDEEPVAVTLYYRVRQATINGTLGTWSAIVSATTSLIETGDMAASAITAIKILAGEITARELMIGDDNGVPVHENDNPVDSDIELIELSSPDCTSNLGLVPSEKTVHYEPAELEDERGYKYRNPHVKMWDGLSAAIFAERKCLAKDSENQSTANWTKVNCAAALSDLSINNLRFTKITCDGGGTAYVRQNITFTISTPAFQALCYKGSAISTSRLRVYDFTAVASRGIIIVDWSAKTVAISDGATHLFYEWLDDETVWIAATANSVVPGNTNAILFYPDINSAAGNYGYCTAIQPEDAAYPSPYIPIYRYPTRVRPAKSPTYGVTMPEMFAFKIKLRPWFIYNTSIHHRFFEWYIDATHRLITNWDATNDLIKVEWRDGGTARVINSQQFDDGSSFDDINAEIIIIGFIRLDQQSGQRFFCIVDGVKQTEDTSFSGVPDALTSSFTTGSLGHENGAAHADSLMPYVKFWNWDGTDPGTLDDEADVDAFTAGLTELFSWTLEDYEGATYKPLSKRGMVGLFQADVNKIKDPEDLTAANWVPPGTMTVELSDYYIGGKRFTKIIDGAAGQSLVQTIAANTFTGDGAKSFSIILKKDTDETDTEVNLYYNPSYYWRVQLNWTTRVITEVVGSTRAEWIAPDVVMLYGTSTSLTAANPHDFQIYPSLTGSATVYATAVLADDLTYPTPYTPTLREASALVYRRRMPPVFTLMFTVWPWFPYNTSKWHTFFGWRVDSTHYFFALWHVTADKIYVVWKNGGTERAFASQQFDDGSSFDDINQPHHIAIKIDLTTGSAAGVELWINGILRANAWNGVPDAYADDFPLMGLGYDSLNANQFDGFMSDLLLVPRLVDASEIKDHYLRNRPWYEPSEIANAERSITFSKAGGRLYDVPMIAIAKTGRQARFSGEEGFFAIDAAGQPLHQTPDAVVQIGNMLMGHLIQFRDAVSVYKIYESTAAPIITWTDVTCVTDENTNVLGGVFKCIIEGASSSSYYAVRALISLRPKGSNWQPYELVGGAVITPGDGIDIQGPITGGIDFVAIRRECELRCPIGDDNKVQFYFRVSPSDSYKLIICQTGLYI